MFKVGIMQERRTYYF